MSSDPFWFPPPPEVAPDQRATGLVELRYEDVTQDGRVAIGAFPQAIGEVIWRRVLYEHKATRGMRDSGVIPILSRLILEGGGGPISVRKPLYAQGLYDLAHSKNAEGGVERLFVNMWCDMTGPASRTHGPQPPNAGDSIFIGRVHAEHVFTRLFAPPGERKVTRLAISGLPSVPPASWDVRGFAQVTAVPEGAELITDGFVDMGLRSFGLFHTDSNQHVNSLVYPRMFEECALSLLTTHGCKTNEVLARYAEVAFRKPFFAGQTTRIEGQLFRWQGKLGVVGVFRDSGAEGETDKPHCYVRMFFG